MKNFANDNTKKTINEILDYYYSKVENDYIPAILNEGDLYNQGNELYIKIIVKPKNTEINKTWLKDNLSIDYSDNIFNLISYYKYKYNDIYGINPVLLNNDVTFVEQHDLDVFDMEYTGHSKQYKRNKILYKNESNIMIYFPLVKDYSGLEKNFDKYVLCAEIEYRVFCDDLKPDFIGKYKLGNHGFVDLIYQKNKTLSVIKRDSDALYWLRATILINSEKLVNRVKEKLNIKVISLDRNNVRKLNPSNYNDDIDPGLVVFDKDAVVEIQKYYYFYDLTLIPRLEHVQPSLVDYFGDLVVFWEGEFNSKLPIELKKSLQKFNLTNKTKNIISSAMYNWQLQGKWEVFDDLYPNQKLARIILKNYRNTAYECQLDFYPPFSIDEYSKFIINILSILKITKKNLKLLPEKEKLLEKIINKEYVFVNNEDLINNFYGFCNLIVKVVGYDKK